MSTLYTTVQTNQIICQPHAWVRFLLEAKGALATRGTAVRAKQRNPAKPRLRLPLEIENPYKITTSVLRDAIR